MTAARGPTGGPTYGDRTYRALTYGESMTYALRQLAQILTGPVAVAPAEAVALAQARTRIYRTAARLAAAAAGPQPPSTPTGAGGRPGSGERRALARLLADLRDSVESTWPVLTLPTSPPPPSSTAAALGRVADAAGLAWDLLPGAPPGGPGSADHAAGWLVDAALLTRGMATLDTTVGPLLQDTAADPALPAAAAAAVRAVGHDCEDLTALRVADHAGEIGRRSAAPLGVDGWARVDAAAAPPTLTRGLLTSPAAAADMVTGYLAWLGRHLPDLTVPDLTSLAAAGFRLVRVVTEFPTADHQAGRAVAAGAGEDPPCGPRCATQFVGRVSWPADLPPDRPGPSRSAYVCADEQHQQAAQDWVRAGTGHPGVLVPFRLGPPRPGRGPVPALADPVHRALRAWRACHHRLRPLRSIHPRPAGHGMPFRLAEWADRQLRRGIPDSPDWARALDTVAGRLPDLAAAGEAALRHLHTSGQLFAPTPEGASPYGPAAATWATPAIDAFAAARASTAALPPTALPQAGRPSLTWPAAVSPRRSAPAPSRPHRPPPPAAAALPPRSWRSR